MELWLHAFALPGKVAPLAREAEAWGFDGMLVADSQSLTADVWVELALAGAATSSLKLAPGVTNPLTRHLAVTASAAATLHAETGGRAALGIGRGDSALSQIGLAPQPVEEFSASLATLQGLLRGERVPLGAATGAIHWIGDAGLPKVPVHAGATGPRTIEAAALLCEGVDLTVGAELQRLRWGLGVARAAARSGSRNAAAGDLALGAYVNVAVSDDRDLARELVRGSAATFARFSTHGAPGTGLSATTARGIERLSAGYERDRHGAAASSFARRLEGEFIDRFAVAGPPAEVGERLREIAGLGFERIVVVPGSLDADPAELAHSNETFAREVLPQLRRA